MELGIGSHPEETEIEQYSMGILASERLQSFEEHFLACEPCQDQLLQMEAYVNAVRSVSPRLRAARSPWARLTEWPYSGLVLSVAAMAILALLAARIWMSPRARSSELAVVTLQASRGIAGLAEATAAPVRPLSIEIDLTELPKLSSYRLQIVDSSGKPQFDGIVAPQGGRIAKPLPVGLPAGLYYVRVYGENGWMLREFGLRVA